MVDERPKKRREQKLGEQMKRMENGREAKVRKTLL